MNRLMVCCVTSLCIGLTTHVKAQTKNFTPPEPTCAQYETFFSLMYHSTPLTSENVRHVAAVAFVRAKIAYSDDGRLQTVEEVEEGLASVKLSRRVLENTSKGDLDWLQRNGCRVDDRPIDLSAIE